MKRTLCLCCAVAMLFLLCSCKDDSARKFDECEPRMTYATKESVKEFMSLMRNMESGDTANGLTMDEDTCYNVTPPEVAEQTDMTIFKYSDSFASFVMVDNGIYPLCEYFGGYGFVNAIPCDFDDDGNKDLLVASSWGSGEHRSVISVFNSVSKESTVLYDTLTTDTPNIDLIVARSTAHAFTDPPDSDDMLYYSVLSADIRVDNPNSATLAYDVIGVEGYIACQDHTPRFVPCQK